MSMDLDAVVRRRPEIMHSDLGEQSVMMDLDAGAYYGLNAVGSRIWALTEEPVAVRSIVAKLVAEFEVDEQECEAAVQSFVALLAEHDIVEVAEPAS